MTKSKGKLVRDKILDLMLQSGIRFRAQRLAREEYERALRTKLMEEAKEFNESPSLEERTWLRSWV